MFKILRHTAVFLSVCLLLCLLACRPSPTETAVPVPDLSAYPWVYLRNDEPLAADEEVVSVLAVGDMMLGRGVLAQSEPLLEAAPWLRAADLTLGNLEGIVTAIAEQVTENGEWIGDHSERITLAMPVTAVSQLQAAGFDLLSLANNHSLDMDTTGFAETAVYLENAGLAPVGLQTDGIILAEIRVVNNVRLAFLAFNMVPDPEGMRCAENVVSPCPVVWHAETAVPAIEQAKAEADAVIVSMHWGFEYEFQPDPSQEKVAKLLQAAGADLILGHHPHVAQPIETSDSGLVAYSLGNFVFDQETAVTQHGMGLLAYFDMDGLRAVQALPIQSGLKPRLLAVGEAESWLLPFLPKPVRVGFICTEVSCTSEEASSSEETGEFFSGQIDLTGDGKPETIRREGERIIIFEAGTAVWQSPDAWRVVDVALGDPNDDGRFEIMLAIWQEDGGGYERSQPYIVGYRGGEYTLLWGGRPVVEPIQELALGDVDGDGIEELVVIVAQADGAARSVAVWQWQGWTFSLQWQSDPGWYESLELEDEGERPFITVILKDRY